MAKPKAYDWEARHIDDWNATTFRAYLTEQHEKHFGVPYQSRGPVAAESKNIKTMYEQYGRQVTKDFIDECFKQYRPNPRYPGVNFMFMKTYMGDVLQRVLTEQKRKENRTQAKEKQQDIDVIGWL